MAEMLAVDRLEVLVLVDNLTDGLSTNAEGVTSEWSGLLTGGRMRMMSGRNICCAHHGLSLLISVQAGTQKHTLLFDAGPEGATFLRNADILGVEFGAISAVVLSHGHWDHAGGLLAAIERIAAARAEVAVGEAPVCYVHPGVFAQRALSGRDGELFVHEPVPRAASLSQAGARVVNTKEPQQVAGGAFFVSGEIPQVTEYETGLPGHIRRGPDGVSWEPDPLVLDERFVSVHVKGKGQVVFTACSHAGVINVMRHAQAVFPGIPLHGVMGGFHLSGVNEKIIPETIRGLSSFGLRRIAPGHCTGWRALSAMAQVFGDELVPSAVGKRYVF